MKSLILTLFPEMFPGPLGHSLAGRALHEGLWSLETLNIRDFATDKHKTVDDSPYGGGTGMVMKPDVVDAAVTAARSRNPEARCIYMTPRGVPLTQGTVQQLHAQNLIILCGRFEGVDQRVIDEHEMLEISMGDYILSGGEIAALALLDACVRLIPGVIGKADALAEESFNEDEKSARLLEYPHYTRPPVWKGRSIPEVLLSGNHAHINAWRRSQAEEITKQRRPDLIRKTL